MQLDAPHSENRTGYRPTWLLLCVDAAGRDWLFRTRDGMVFVINERRVVKRQPLPADESPEALLAHVDAEIGICTRYLAGSMAEAITPEVAE
jgi:hypothetical protein